MTVHNQQSSPSLSERSAALITWNRAAMVSPSTELRAGDRALASLLRAHSLVMNGGVFHAVDVMKDEEIGQAIAGYTFFGLSPAGALLSCATRLVREHREVESQETLLDVEYFRVIPDDSALFCVFERHFMARRNDFAPV